MQHQHAFGLGISRLNGVDVPSRIAVAKQTTASVEKDGNGRAIRARIADLPQGTGPRPRAS